MKHIAVALLAMALFSTSALASGGYLTPMPSSDPRFPLEDLSFEYNVRKRRTRIEGYMVNESGQYLSSSQFDIEFYDYYGTSLGSSFTNYAQFENGESKDFQLTVRDSDVRGAVYYEVKVTSSTPELPRARRRPGPPVPAPSP